MRYIGLLRRRRRKSRYNRDVAKPPYAIGSRHVFEMFNAQCLMRDERRETKDERNQNSKIKIKEETMEIKVVDRQGRVVIPVGLRRKFKMKAGTKITFIDTDDGVVVRVINKKYFDGFAGALGLRDKHLKSLMDGKQHTQYLKTTHPIFSPLERGMIK